MPMTYQDILEVEVRTKRGGDCVIYKGRMYVRNTAPYWQIRTQQWAEYFVCQNGCDDCKGRVIRFTPIDGRLPYVRESTDMRTIAHSQYCLQSETKIVIRKAKQLFFKEVAISVHSSHRRSIREEYNEIRRLLLHNRGKLRWCSCPHSMCNTFYIPASAFHHQDSGQHPSCRSSARLSAQLNGGFASSGVASRGRWLISPKCRTV